MANIFSGIAERFKRNLGQFGELVDVNKKREESARIAAGAEARLRAAQQAKQAPQISVPKLPNLVSPKPRVAPKPVILPKETGQVLKTTAKNVFAGLPGAAERFISEAPITKIIAGVPVERAFRDPEKEVQIAREIAEGTKKYELEGKTRAQAERLARATAPTKLEQQMNLAMGFVNPDLTKIVGTGGARAARGLIKELTKEGDVVLSKAKIKEKLPGLADEEAEALARKTAPLKDEAAVERELNTFAESKAKTKERPKPPKEEPRFKPKEEPRIVEKPPIKEVPRAVPKPNIFEGIRQKPPEVTPIRPPEAPPVRPPEVPPPVERPPEAPPRPEAPPERPPIPEEPRVIPRVEKPAEKETFRTLPKARAGEGVGILPSEARAVAKKYRTTISPALKEMVRNKKLSSADIEEIEKARRRVIAQESTSKIDTPKGIKKGAPEAPTPEKAAIELAQGQPRVQKAPPVSLESPEGVSKISSLANDNSILKAGQGVNVNRLNISDDARNLIKDEFEGIKTQLEDKVGRTLTNEEVQNLAEESSKVLQRVIGREQTLAWEAALLKLRQRLANSAESGQVTREFLDDLTAVKTLGADVGRKLQSFSIQADPRAVTTKQTILSEILKVTDDADTILAKAKGVDFNDFKQAANFYREFIKPSLGEWVDLVRYNSMLSSPRTHIVNIFSNLANSTLRAPLTKVMAGGLDFLGSKIFRKARTQFAGEAGAYVGGYLQNTGNAFKRFADVWKGTREFTNLDLRSIPLATKGKTGMVNKALSVPMRLLEGADQFFMALAGGGESAALKLRQAKGVKVPRLAESAEDAARYGLFRQELFKEGQGTVLDAIDVMTSKILGLRRSPNPIVSTIAKFTVPFVSTPMNIFKQGLEYSPAGLLTTFKAANKSEQVAKALIGTGIGAAAGTLIASNRMTWGEPRNADERNAYRENGMQPYSVKLGDRWYSYQKLPPFLGFPLSMTAAVNDAIKNKKLNDTDAEFVLSSFAKYAEFLADQSYFKSIGDFMNALSGDKFAISQLIGNYPQQLVPFRALGGWMARLTDGLQRQIDNKAGFIDKQVQLLMLNIPGLRQQLPARLGPSGQPIPERNRVFNALSPISSIQQTSAEAGRAQTLQELKSLKSKQNETRSLLQEEAKRLYDEFSQLPKEEANVKARELKEENPQLYEKLKDLVEENKLGLSYEDKQVKSLGVENGERAKYVWDQVSKLGTREEKNAYIEELRKKKIITNQVFEQLKKLKTQ